MYTKKYNTSLLSKYIKFCELVFWLFDVRVFTGQLNFPPRHIFRHCYTFFWIRLHFYTGKHFQSSFTKLIRKSLGLVGSLFCSVKISVTFGSAQLFLNTRIFKSLLLKFICLLLLFFFKSVDAFLDKIKVW